MDLAHDRLRLAMESGKTVGWDGDVKSGRDIWFGDLKTVFGIPSDNYVGQIKDFLGRVHPDDRGQVWKAVNAAKQSHQMYAAEHHILRADGTVRWIATQDKFLLRGGRRAQAHAGHGVRYHRAQAGTGTARSRRSLPQPGAWWKLSPMQFVS